MSVDTHSTAPSNEKGLVWFRTKRRVAWSDCDPASIYTFTAALHYVEDAEVGMLRSKSLLQELYPRLPRIYLEANYHAPARFEDELTIALAITRLGKSSIHFAFEISREAAICASGQYGVCYLGRDGKPAAIPGHVYCALSPISS